MYSERLYSLAFAVRKTKLWKTLYDNELFAVSLSNGEIGYCSVMGPKDPGVYAVASMSAMLI